jgi:putative tryptophan/tyrosine transport system substrate-binding protein
MRRRDFIMAAGGTATWSVAAHAQPAAMPVVGYLFPDTLSGALTTAFRSGLSETGFVEGRNVVIEYRAASSNYGRLPELAADLVRHRVAVIYAGGSLQSPLAAKAATDTIPIVFTVGADPVEAGLVASLNRPGGNVTGIAFLTAELGPKRLELFSELLPTAKRFALLVQPDSSETKSIVAGLSTAAALIGRHVEVFNARRIDEIDAAFADLVRKGADALIVGSSSMLNTRRIQLPTSAAYYHLPTMFYDRRAVEVGGLMSYGANILDVTQQAGVYVGRILKGEMPANMPVVQTTKFELVINLQTARTLGIRFRRRCSPPPTR